MGTITFHPWPVRSKDVDHPDELRLDLDPQPGTDFTDAVRVAGEAHALLDELGYTGFPKTSGGRGIHIYVRIEPRWTFTDVRHAAIAFGRQLERRCPDRSRPSGGRRSAASGSSSTTTRTRATGRSPRPTASGRNRARPYQRRCAGRSSTEVVPEDFTVATMPARFAEVGDRHADDRRRRLLAASRCSSSIERDEAEGEGDMPYPPDYPKMPGEPKRVQPSRDRDRKQ